MPKETDGIDEHSTSDPESPVAWPLDRMPPCYLPPTEQFQPVEHYVTVAITSRSESASEETITTPTKLERNEGGTSEASTTPSLSGYSNILDCIRKRDDPAMLWKILLSLRARSLSIIASSPSQHAYLMHLLMKLSVFSPPKSLLKNQDLNSDKSKSVLGALSKNEDAIQFFTDYTLADAYLHLLVGLVSANSIFLIPCLESIWKNLVTTPDTSKLK